MSTEHWIDTSTHLILPSSGPSPASWGRGRRNNNSFPSTLQPLFSKCTLPRQLTLHTWCQKISRYASSEHKWVLLKQKMRKYLHSETAWFFNSKVTSALPLIYIPVETINACVSVWCKQLTLYEGLLHFNIVLRCLGVSRCSNSFNLL